jgi:hypothetical protein
VGEGEGGGKWRGEGTHVKHLRRQWRSVFESLKIIVSTFNSAHSKITKVI